MCDYSTCFSLWIHCKVLHASCARHWNSFVIGDDVDDDDKNNNNNITRSTVFHKTSPGGWRVFMTPSTQPNRLRVCIIIYLSLTLGEEGWGCLNTGWWEYVDLSGRKRQEAGKNIHDELYNLFCTPNIIRVIKSRRIKWAVHVTPVKEVDKCIYDFGRKTWMEENHSGELGVDGG